jgi:low temperature requirement protein LtrA
LIVAAAGLSGAVWSTSLILGAILAVMVSCALWWTYFPRVKPSLEHALASVRAAAQGNLGRDAFSLAHFPMLCGVIAYAAAIEEAVSHPDRPLHTSARLALAAGLLLFLGGAGTAVWRATRMFLRFRFVTSIVTAAVVAVLAGVDPHWSLAIAFVGTGAIAVHENRLGMP